MRKKILILICFLSVFGSNGLFAAVSKMQVQNHVSSLYAEFDFTRHNKMSMQAFAAGVTGYYNLKEEGKISKDVLTICDFTKSANQKRMWILDMKKKKILLFTYVAHGQGSGDEFVRRFSNVHDSHTSSQGFYNTGSIYHGKNGRSIKLHGLDGRFNSNAYDRAIVLHGADYVSERFIKENGRLGRSYGCPAVERRLANTVINYIAGRSAFFIYSPSNGYMQRSHWITSPISKLPNSSGSNVEANSSSSSPKSIKKVIPKTQTDSLRMGLIEPNTPLGDGKVYIGRTRITRQEADRIRREELKKKLLKARALKNSNRN